MTRHDRLAVAVIAALLPLLIALAWCRYDAGSDRLRFAEPRVTSGDEPHYLLVVNSILFDGDLDLRRDYSRVRDGSIAAGRRFAGRALDHHTLIVGAGRDSSTRWVDVFKWRVPIECPPGDTGCSGFARKTQRFPDLTRTVERSAHPIGFPAIVAGALWLAGAEASQVEAGMALVVIAFAWLGVVFTYLTARRLDASPRAAGAAALLLGAASPWLVYARSYFSEPVIGAALIVALWGLVTERRVLAGAAVAVATIVKPPFVLVGVAWCALYLARRQLRPLLEVGVPLAAGVLGLVCFNVWQAATPLISGVWGWQGILSAAELPRTLIHPRFGLLPFVPWALLSFVALAMSLRTRALRPLVWIAAPTAMLLVLFALHRPLGATCYGPRYWVPLLPWLAIAAAAAPSGLRRGRRVAQGALLVAAVAAALVAVPGAILYRQVWNQGPLAALSILTGG